MSSFKTLGATVAIRVSALEPAACSRATLTALRPKTGIPTSSTGVGQSHYRYRHYTTKLESQQRYSGCLPMLCRRQSEKQYSRLLLSKDFLSTFQLRKASSSSSITVSARNTRSSSTSTSSSSSLASATTSATANVRKSSAKASGHSSKQSVLNWNEFLLLRRRRRVTGLAFSIATALTSTAAGLSIATSRDLDAVAAAATGLDPFIILAIGTLTFAGIGWLAGPFVGNVFFAVFARRRGVWKEFAAKDRAFLHRIRARRVDPSGASIQNPVPDYYGEKIGSVADYRRWLKDQRAFNLKRGDRVGSAVAGSVGTAAESAAVSASRLMSRRRGVS